MNIPAWKFRFAMPRLFLFAWFVIAAAGGSALAATRPETETVDLGDGVMMDFVLIPAGSFTMGSARNSLDERPVHQVTFTQSFYLGKFEVTQEQWEKIMGANPSHFKGAKLPVENVSWDDCQIFLAELRKKLGRKFALPNEAQWEYACRAGTTTMFSCGDDAAVLSDYAWHSGNSGLTTHPVGEKKPNPWGLYDMHGNVFEWCADWYSDGYPEGEATDPTGAATGERRTIRGGAWLYVIDNQRSSDRGFSPPDYRINEYGFRCVMLAGDAGAASGAVTQLDPNAILLARLDAAVSEGNKFYAAQLLAEAEKLMANDGKLAAMRRQIATLPAPKETLVVELAAGVRMEFVLIRPGSFTMGSNESPLDNERPAHRVTITRPFYLGKFEVTQQQWQSLMGRNQSYFKAGDPAQLPIENVSWLLAQDFLAKLNAKLPADKFRLPTEAEWEYACRAGSSGPHSFGEGSGLDAHAWHGANAGGTTHPIGGKIPNAWGLSDMYGNVWEWCQDQLGPYRGAELLDPTGPASGSGGRVLRGGAWNNSANHVNSTFRHDDAPNVLMRYYGFRCVAEISPDPKK